MFASFYSPVSLPWTADHLVPLKSSLEKRFGFCSIVSLLIWGWCYGTTSSVGPSDLILAVIMSICTLPSKEKYLYLPWYTSVSPEECKEGHTESALFSIEYFPISILISPLYFTQERMLKTNYFQSKHMLPVTAMCTQPVHMLCRPMMSENK